MGSDYQGNAIGRNDREDISAVVKLHPKTLPHLLKVLTEAGCVVVDKREHIEVAYPNGIVRTQEGLSSNVYWDKLIFPNGTILYEQSERFRENKVNLFFPDEYKKVEPIAIKYIK